MEWTNLQPSTTAPHLSGDTMRNKAPKTKFSESAYCKQGDLVFDVGGHHGDNTSKFLACGASVIVFEPQPSCLAYMGKRFDQDSNVKIVMRGLGAKDESLELSICNEMSEISTFAAHWKTGRFLSSKWDEKVAVQVTTLDAMIKEFGRPKICRIDVEGFEYQVLCGLSQPIPYVIFEFTKEFVNQASLCLHQLLTMGYTKFNVRDGQDNTLCFDNWVSADQVTSLIMSHSNIAFWGDIVAYYDKELPISAKQQSTTTPAAPAPQGILEEFTKRGIWQPGQELRLHLGCGEQLFRGYVNIDYPSSNHAVMKVNPDYTADITKLSFPSNSVSEIRLHHVFEHFTRVHALALLVRWHEWLRIGGKLHISTPDFDGCAKTFLAPNTNWATKMGLIRHLAGDQTASWAFHLDHWFPERFQHTLSSFGYGSIVTQSSMWDRQPWLSNVDAVAVKVKDHSREELIQIADKLLYESLVAVEEQSNHDVWSKQLREFLAN